MKLFAYTAWVFAIPASVMVYGTSPYDKDLLIAIAAYGAITFAAGWVTGRLTQRRAV